MRGVLAALLLLAGCDGRAVWEAEAARRLAAADALAAAVTTPSAPEGTSLPSASERLARLLVSDALVLDRSGPARTTAYPENGDAAERALALPPEPLTFGVVRDGEVALPGSLDDEGHPLDRPLGAPLDALLFRREELHAVSVRAAGVTPVRAVARALALIADLAGTTRAELVLGSASGDVAVPLTVRRLVSGPASSAVVDPLEDELGLVFTLGEHGIAVRGSGGDLAPGCQRLERGALTIPHLAGVPDLAAVRACVGAVMAQFPDQRVVYVDAWPTLPIAQAVPVLASIHAGSDGRLAPVLLPASPLVPLEPPMPSLEDVLRDGAITGTSADVLAPGS